MKKLFVFVFLIVFALGSFFVSGLFFLNSGIIDFRGTDQPNETRIVEILRELDKIPFIYLDSDDLGFRVYGEVLDVEEERILVRGHGREIWFDGVNGSRFNVGDVVAVSYKYNSNFNIEVESVRKILQLKDVIDFDTCVSYGGYVHRDVFPRECEAGKAVFVQSVSDVKEKCLDLGGVWLEEYLECVGIDRKDCYSLFGKYFECESACRHDPDAEVCGLVCVEVCSFGKD